MRLKLSSSPGASRESSVWRGCFTVLGSRGISLQTGLGADEKLAALRKMYEPYVHSLSKYRLMPLPAWELAADSADNWQTSAWERVGHV